ncbi:MAG: nucleoside-diphosphate sugar epimerase, partial [Chloroflexota bacterium]|nr:nucleoside-diphosphate sugar epimerase [Chloroflexota bacterium]
DTALGIVRAAECDELLGRPINIACGEEVSIKRVAEIILRTVGRVGLGIAQAPARPGDVRRHFADIQLARGLLHFSPSVSIEEGISRYVDWLRQNAPDPRALLAEQEPVNWLPELAATG